MSTPLTLRDSFSIGTKPCLGHGVAGPTLRPSVPPQPEAQSAGAPRASLTDPNRLHDR